LLPQRQKGKNLKNSPEENLLHIIILIRKENLISLLLQRIFLKISRKVRKRNLNLNLKNTSQKENVLTVEK
jgi:hypothetical protein